VVVFKSRLSARTSVFAAPGFFFLFKSQSQSFVKMKFVKRSDKNLVEVNYRHKNLASAILRDN
jgi:hypothetical protein